MALAARGARTTGGRALGAKAARHGMSYRPWADSARDVGSAFRVGRYFAPALAYCSDEPVVETITCAWPAIRSVSAGASPRYGTWVNLMPAIIWNSSADM